LKASFPHFKFNTKVNATLKKNISISKHLFEQVLADRDVFLQSSIDLGVELEMWKARFQNLALCFSAVVVGAISFAVFFANR
jgi:hypothetical protein